MDNEKEAIAEDLRVKRGNSGGLGLLVAAMDVQREVSSSSEASTSPTPSNADSHNSNGKKRSRSLASTISTAPPKSTNIHFEPRPATVPQLAPHLLHPSLIPPPNLLHLYQAHLQAALSLNQQNISNQLNSRLYSSSASAFQPVNSCQNQTLVSPDSSTTTQNEQNTNCSADNVNCNSGAVITYNQHCCDSNTLINGAEPPLTSTQFNDGKQYLRYKLLERQNRLGSDQNTLQQQPNDDKYKDKSCVEAAHNSKKTIIEEHKQQPSLLGSLLASRSSPPILQSRTELESGLSPSKMPASSIKSSTPTILQYKSGAIENDSDLKQCLSSLAVHLNEQSTNAKSSDLSNSADSPASSASSPEDSTNSSHSPLQNAGGNNKDELNGHKQRYVERRKRNNEAAKRCRANRRALFDYRLKRAEQLETENCHLRDEMLRLTNELLELKRALAAGQSPATTDSGHHECSVSDDDLKQRV